MLRNCVNEITCEYKIIRGYYVLICRLPGPCDSTKQTTMNSHCY